MIRPFLRIQVQCKSVAGRRPSRWAIKRSDVITRLSVKGFQGCFANWTEAIRQATGGEVIAVDGKTVRGSRDRKRGRAALYMVSAWADTNRRVLGQEATAEKCNEITAIPKLLELLERMPWVVSVRLRRRSSSRVASNTLGSRTICL